MSTPKRDLPAVSDENNPNTPVATPDPPLKRSKTECASSGAGKGVPRSPSHKSAFKDTPRPPTPKMCMFDTIDNPVQKYLACDTEKSPEQFKIMPSPVLTILENTRIVQWSGSALKAFAATLKDTDDAYIVFDKGVIVNI